MSKQASGQCIVIPILGSTGAGKSTFINHLVRKDVMKVGKGLNHCTTELHFIYLDAAQHPRFKGHIVVVDTPGFRGEEQEDRKILKNINDQLGNWLQLNRAILGGVIYLHDISNDGFARTAQWTLQRFQERWGQEILNKAVVGTTKWRGPETNSNDKMLEAHHWKSLVEKGTKILQLGDSPESAWTFIHVLMPQVYFRSPHMMSKQRSTQDIVILVMGSTGAGKSTFINHLLGEDFMKVGKTLGSCTSELQFAYLDSARYPHLNGRLVIVDTPGFDDTYKGDEEIMKKFADWLRGSYKKKNVFGGVIYLHDITNNRFPATARRDIDMLQRLWGQDGLSKVILGTTMWSKTDPATADAHQAELRDVHWNGLTAKGAKVLPFRNTAESAWSFVDILMSNLTHQNLKNVYLQIQREIGDDKKSIPGTEAGKGLRFTLQEVFEMQQKMVTLENDMAGGGERARSQIQEIEKRVKQLAAEIKALKIPFSRKLRRLFNF